MKILRAVLFAALLLAPALTAEAQSAVTVNIARATLDWSWAQGVAPNDGVATGFNMKCGQTTGVYTKITLVSNPATRSIPVSTAISGQGNWFCVVSALNGTLESANSAEVPFVAGAIPSTPASLVITAH